MDNIMNKTLLYKWFIILVLLPGLVLTSIARAAPVKNPMEADLDGGGFNIFNVNDVNVNFRTF